MSRVCVCVCVGHRCVYIADVRTVDACVDVLCSYMCCKCVSSFVISFFSQHVDLLFSFSLHLSLLSRPEQRSRSGREIRIFYFLSFFLPRRHVAFYYYFFLVFFPSFLGDASSGDAEFPLASEHCRSFSFSLSFWHSLLLSSV